MISIWVYIDTDENIKLITIMKPTLLDILNELSSSAGKYAGSS